jgi:hypothetical protein
VKETKNESFVTAEYLKKPLKKGKKSKEKATRFWIFVRILMCLMSVAVPPSTP